MISLNKLCIPVLIAGLTLLTPGTSKAVDDKSESNTFLSHFEGTLGTSWSFGQLSSSSMALSSRAMNSLSIEAYPAYRFENFSLGIDFDFSFLGQITSLDPANGTNLRGNSYTFGLGAGYKISPEWSIQGSIAFLGKYNFTQSTSNGEDAYLGGPLGFRVKAQYHPFQDLPFSADLDLRYISWSKFVVSGNEAQASSSQWMAGLGFSYHLGTDQNMQAKNPISAPQAVVPVQTPEATSQGQDASKVEE